MEEGNALWFWPVLAWARLVTAIRQQWKRILVGAIGGWIFAVIGGAFALASLEFHDVISRATSDEIGIALVLYCVGFGALNAYAFRPIDRR